jgi:hypothetical protein
MRQVLTCIINLKEIFTGYIPVGVSFFVAKKSGKETDMKSVRDPPE